MASANQEEGIKIFGATITLQSRSARVQVVNPIQDELAKEDDHRIKENPTVISVDQVRRPEKVIPCPRCKSMETKFCYFNNYNVNQPRHFCKGCQRYWTAGGALRNVPVGAGRRKIKAPITGHGGVGGGGGGVCLYDGLSGVHQFELDGSVVMEEWHVATVHDGVRDDFPAKRRRSDSSGCQTC